MESDLPGHKSNSKSKPFCAIAADPTRSCLEALLDPCQTTAKIFGPLRRSGVTCNVETFH